MFDLGVITTNWEILLRGALETLRLAGASCVLALLIGVSLGIVRTLPLRPLTWASRIYVEIWRGTPLLVQMYLLYFGLPSFGIVLSPFVAATIALSNNTGCYMAELVRSAIQGVSRGQVEAARALGLSYWQSLRLCVLPPAGLRALPGITGDLMDTVKWSSVAAVVVVPEATQVVGSIINLTFQGFGSLFLLLGLYYLAINYVIARLGRRLERSIARRQMGRVPANG